VTIEPGIYVRATRSTTCRIRPRNRAMIERLRPAQQRYVNIGVRIEDVYIFDDAASSAFPRACRARSTRSRR
jgi:hypothetical protein